MSLRINFPKLISFVVICLFSVCCGYIFFTVIDHREVSALTVQNLEKKTILHDSVIIGDKDEKIFWFLQLTDLHLSKFYDLGKIPDLKRFLKYHVPVLSPDIILVSGDLTDAKSKSAQDSDQHVEEWTIYKNVIEESGVLQKVKWLDLRGNHDAFNVPNLYHHKNFYSRYSVQGRQHKQSYMYAHRKSYGVYSIIAMDACPSPGPKRPYNFFGVVSSSTIQVIQHYSHLATGSNLTFWFGHYPTSTIVSPGYDLRAFIGKTAVAYLCGHLHTLGRRVLSMYSLQPQGYLELELGDWKESRYFRMVAVDHDLMSFTDEILDKWPVVLVTNPKDSSHLLPNKEPVDRISKSTHIRILAFSVDPIKSVEVYIDGQYIGQAQQVRLHRPLFTLRWDPDRYVDADSGSEVQHNIQVIVKDSGGRKRRIQHPFSVTGKPAWRFQYLQSFILLSDMIHVVRIIYYTLWISLFSPVVIMRFMRYKQTVKRYFVQQSCWINMLYNFSQNDLLFYPWILYFLYSACGPLMLGPIISGGLNLVFVHGLYINGIYIPEAFPYVTETIQNLVFMLPLLIYFCRRETHPRPTRATLWPSQIRLDLRQHWGIYVLMTIQSLYTFASTYMPYGLLVTLLSPCRLGLLLLAWFMHLSTLGKYSEHYRTHISNDKKSVSTHFQSNTDSNHTAF